MLIAFDRVSERFASIMRGNIHEIRRINTDIYYASLQSEQEIRQKNIDVSALERLVGNVSALSQILKCRTDYIDFLSNPSVDILPKHNVLVYRKFDKVVRGLRPTAARRNIRIFMNGTSHGTIQGMPLFDVAPYIILDNAVKYSPNNNNINVTFNESAGFINVEVTSLGPKVEDDEIMKIFTPGFRGRNAAKTGKTGSGIGLSSLDSIISKIHRGKLDFTQDESQIVIANVPYCDTHFKLRLIRNDDPDANQISK